MSTTMETTRTGGHRVVDVIAIVLLITLAITVSITFVRARRHLRAVDKAEQLLAMLDQTGTPPA